MKRRNFIKNSTVASASLLSLNSFALENNNIEKHVYNLKYAPHYGMFKSHVGNGIIDQLKFMSDQGFSAFEDNGMKNRDIKTQEKIGNFLINNDMKMGVFVAHKIHWNKPNLASGDINKRKEFLNDIKESIIVAKRVNAKWMTVVPGHLDLKLDINFQTENVIETLKQACEILESHNLTMVLEPLNFRDHPGLFLTESPQAFQICKSVNSPSCKILFDIYHQQISEGDLIENIRSNIDRIGHFHAAGNPGRHELQKGEIAYPYIFEQIRKAGFAGYVGLEYWPTDSECLFALREVADWLF